MDDNVLQTIQLSKQYGNTAVVDNVDMTIRKGDIYGFIGKNGAGKTTMIRLITSLVKPTTGSISLFGSDAAKDLEDGRKRIGAIIETPAFFPKMTAKDNLEYYRLQRGIADKQAVQQALQTVNLTDTGKKKYEQFSLGMKQRLALALSIIGKPDFLILDEPINGLDPTGIIEFRDIIRCLHDEHCMTLLISSHILSELVQVATTYGIIHNGKLLRQFSQTELENDTKRYISIHVDDPAQAATIIEENLHTHNYEVFPDKELRVYSFLDDPSAVISQLSANNIRVSSFSEMGTSLEDYFLQVLEKEQ